MRASLFVTSMLSESLVHLRVFGFFFVDFENDFLFVEGEDDAWVDVHRVYKVGIHLEG